MKGFRLDKKRAIKLIELIDKCNGHCPCAIQKDDTTLCPCDEFIKNKKCICGMYTKIKEKTND